MKTILFRLHIGILLSLTLLGCAGSRFVPDELSGDVTWSGVVHVRGDVIVDASSRLLIEPGTEVVFHPPGEAAQNDNHPRFPGSELIVQGEIIAEGNAAKPIVFRYADPAAPAGSWGGINLESSRHASFSYCYFFQADSAIHSQESTVGVSQSIFRNNLVAIRFHSSRIVIENNVISGNGSGVRFHFGQPVIRNNRIVGNNKGFFITSHPSDYLIVDNTIADNDWNVVLGEEVPEDVVMTGNYWGETDPEVIQEFFFDGQVESYIGRVLVEPFLTDPPAKSGTSWNR